MADGDRARWSPYATVGYDGMIHTYALSESRHHRDHLRVHGGLRLRRTFGTLGPEPLAPARRNLLRLGALPAAAGGGLQPARQRAQRPPAVGRVPLGAGSTARRRTTRAPATTTRGVAVSACTRWCSTTPCWRCAAPRRSSTTDTVDPGTGLPRPGGCGLPALAQPGGGRLVVRGARGEPGLSPTPRASIATPGPCSASSITRIWTGGRSAATTRASGGAHRRRDRAPVGLEPLDRAARRRPGRGPDRFCSSCRTRSGGYDQETGRLLRFVAGRRPDRVPLGRPAEHHLAPRSDRRTAGRRR